jgi:hypothetical protein
VSPIVGLRLGNACEFIKILFTCNRRMKLVHSWKNVMERG